MKGGAASILSSTAGLDAVGHIDTSECKGTVSTTSRHFTAVNCIEDRGRAQHALWMVHRFVLQPSTLYMTKL
ncbi:hypothetical protein PFLUV_G00066420 [Perca fluviatilis]|uniref:Uncharacterized protein n=1 Tax=Perca fluviatilis TaxID=8168 RepID=A0A6A5EHQ4_PERFL|nr:hypothetical protein PFLUV_G00066420 [Perca fluviatilis]